MNLYIVEDSPLIQHRLVRMVDELPHIRLVGVAGDIETAYRGIVNSDTDALILDIQLSDGNGLALLKNIKQFKPQVKVMILTNHSTNDNRFHTMRAGADDFLDKSTDFALIPFILNQWCDATSTGSSAEFN